MATAASETAPPQLVEKMNSKSRVWKYFAFEADDQGFIIDLPKTYMQTVPSSFSNERWKHFHLNEAPQRQTSRFIQRIQVE